MDDEGQLTLRARRMALGLTQADLADRLGVTTRTLIRLEQTGELPRLYDLAVRALELERVTAPDYGGFRNRPRQPRQG